MASASSTSARSLFVESKMRLADRVQVNVNNIASLARQIQRGSRSSETKKKKALSFHTKLLILRELEMGIKNSYLCQKYGVKPSTISSIRTRANEIKEKASKIELNEGSLEQKRLKTNDLDLLERTVYAWLCEKRMSGLPVSGKLLAEKALMVFEILQNGGSIPKKVKFNASQGWLDRFKKRHSIRTLQGKGEKASADSESSRDFSETMTMLVRDRGYPLDNIFNADETGLHYKSLPEKTLAVRTETEVPGHKQKKEHITVMLCANASGSFRVPPLCIGTAQKPRCFKADTNLPCEYRGTKKAWVTSEVFLDWYQNIFLKAVKAWKPYERFLLFLDNSRTHLSAEELNEIDEQCFVVFLPDNCTSLIQPMDMGVISATKRQYRTAFLRELLASECRDKNEVENFVKKWDVLRTMQIFTHAWYSITPSTLRNAWNNVLPNPVEENSSNQRLVQHATGLDTILDLLNNVPGGKTISISNADEWLEEDENLATCETKSDELIINETTGLNLTIPESEDESENEAEELKEKERTTLSKIEVRKASQIVLEYSREVEHFTHEERAAFTKLRNMVFDLHHD